MAGIAAGVVGAAEVNTQPSQPSKLSGAMAMPVTWATIWFLGALFYLIAIYYGLIRIRTGE